MKNVNAMKFAKLMMLLLGCSVVTDMQAMKYSKSPGDTKNIVGTPEAPKVCEKCSSHETPLHQAAHLCHDDCLSTQIDAKADVNLQNEYGFATLHYASSAGRIDCVRKLIAIGARVDIQSIHGDTALQCAAHNGRDDCLRALIDAKADVNLQETWGGRTPLFFAAANGQVNCVQALIGAGANVMHKSKGGQTALHYAAISWIFSGKDLNRIRNVKKCIKLLISAGAVRDLGPIPESNLFNQATNHHQAQSRIYECYRDLQEDIINGREDWELINALEDISIDAEDSE